MAWIFIDIAFAFVISIIFNTFFFQNHFGRGNEYVEFIDIYVSFVFVSGVLLK